MSQFSIQMTETCICGGVVVVAGTVLHVPDEVAEGDAEEVLHLKKAIRVDVPVAATKRKGKK